MPRLKPLPDREGPKLEPFTDDLEAHDFEVVDLNFVRDGACEFYDGMIYRVKIDGKLYVLKVFNPRDVMYPTGDQTAYGEGNYGELALKDISSLDLDKHMNPFECECRAFGRLKETGQEDLAVRVHGYVELYVTEKMEERFSKAFLADPEFVDGHGNAWPMLKVLCCPEWDVSRPIMCIVKDYVEGSPDFTDEKARQQAVRNESQHYGRMLQNLLKLHQLGIVNRDVRRHQYVNGILVDMSQAWTIPHVLGPEAGYWPAWSFLSWAAWDLWSFQTQVIDEWNDIDWAEYPLVSSRPGKCFLEAYKIDRHPEARARLRPRGSDQSLVAQPPFLPILQRVSFWGPVWSRLEPMRQIPPHDPAEFDWRAAGLAKAAGTPSPPPSKTRSGKRAPAPSTSVPTTKRAKRGAKNRTAMAATQKNKVSKQPVTQKNKVSKRPATQKNKVSKRPVKAKS